jgi:hypothetical protein
MDMGGITREEDAPLPIARDLPLIDAEEREPGRIADRDVRAAAAIDHRLHIGECGGLAWMRRIGLADRRDDTRPSARDRKGGQGTVTMQEDRNLIGCRRTLARQANIGERPIVALRLAGEFDSRAVPHGAVGTIAADEPRRAHSLFAAIGAMQTRFDPTLLLGETDELDLPLDSDAERAEMGGEQPLDVALRQHEREMIGARNVVEAGAAEHLAIAADRDGVGAQPRFEEGRRRA